KPHIRTRLRTGSRNHERGSPRRVRRVRGEHEATTAPIPRTQRTAALPPMEEEEMSKKKATNKKAKAKARAKANVAARAGWKRKKPVEPTRSEEHTSELQSRFDLVCRLLLEKKKEKTA